MDWTKEFEENGETVIFIETGRVDFRIFSADGQYGVRSTLEDREMYRCQILFNTKQEARDRIDQIWEQQWSSLVALDQPH